MDRAEAFADLVGEAYRPMLRYLARRADAATADDALGDALLVLWRRFDDVPGDARVAWCIGVARGCLANRRRSEQRQHRLVERLAATATPPDAPATDPALEEAWQHLGDKDREVLRLWAWEQLMPREIAVVLGITPNAAGVRLHRATAKLRTELRKSRAPAGQVPGRQAEAIHD